MSTPDPADRRGPLGPAASRSPVGDDAWAGVSATLARYARSLTGRDDEADDLAQRVLVRLLERAPDKADHLGYAYTAMTRLWISEQRAVRRRAARFVARAEELVSGWRGGADHLEHAEQVRLAQRRIESLPPMQRAALVLRVVEGLGYDAIAEHLGSTVEAVRANLHLARKRLRALAGEPS